MFTSYRIGFCSVSQNIRYDVNTRSLRIFMLSVSLKTLNIMCFDGKTAIWKKKTRESTAIVITKECRKY